MAITKASGNAVSPAAKGDLVAGSATNDAAVLGVGANGTTLVANSSTATGLEWVGGAWTAFTPTWTGLTVGNGVYNQSHYSLVGKTATFAIDFSLGSTSAVTGAVTLTLPTVLARKNVYTTGPLYSILKDTGTGDVLGFPATNTSDAQGYSVFFADDAVGGVFRSQLSSTTPFTWASTDRIIYSGTIEVA
jgi:hypothetical protein